MIIYKLTSPSGKVYIGQSKYDLDIRWQQHLWLWQLVSRSDDKKRTRLHHAFNKYEPELWKREILLECEQEFASLREQEEIQKHDSFQNGYNMTLGGEGLNGADFSELHRSGISKAKKLWWDSPIGQKKKMELSEQFKKNNPSSILKGKPSWNAGRKMPPRNEDWCRNISKATTGKPKSKEAIEKMRISKTGTKLSEEHKLKIKNTMTGQVRGESHRQKTSAAKSCSWQVITPTGEVMIIYNLRAYCRENGLDPGNLSRGTHKCYKATRLTDKGQRFHK